MDDLLIPYFENINDGAAQGQFLKEFANDKVSNGICFHLTLTWMYLYQQKQHQVAPNIIWTEMKNPVMIKQIANNQRAYLDPTGDVDVNSNLQYYNLQGGQVIIGNWDNNMIVGQINVPGINNVMKLITFHLFDEKGNFVGAHAIGTILHGEKIYLFDPNVGVMTAFKDKSHELMNKIPYIYSTKNKWIIRNVNLYYIH